MCSAMNASSARPSANKTCIAPRASAASLPGRSARWTSAAFAVRVRTGSTHTIVAPRLRASRKNFQRCRWVDTMFAPHATTERALHRVFDVSCRPPAVGQAPRGRSCGKADRAVDLRGAERVGEARVHRRATLEHAGGAHVAEREHARRPAAFDCGQQASARDRRALRPMSPPETTRCPWRPCGRGA